MNQSGLIWVTGFSGAGKTTIGRKIFDTLNKNGHKCIFLDGDDIRSVFGGRFGYDRSQRVELAKSYLKLSSHLSSQGFIVILTAVALYDEVVDWMRLFVPNSIQVYLDVPFETRLKRDLKTKHVYKAGEDNDKIYDTPKNPDLVVSNIDGNDIDNDVKRIVDSFFCNRNTVEDLGRSIHWDSYYALKNLTQDPSPFAIEVAKKIKSQSSIIEVGCGNGRDLLYFASLGHSVLGIDRSSVAIDHVNQLACKQSLLGVKVFSGVASDLLAKSVYKYDVAYSRFVFHAMPLSEEVETLESLSKLINIGGSLFVECRSINDPMARVGDILGPAERINGHYRRFIIMEELVDRVKSSGFKIISCIESDGFAKIGDDNPVLIRLHAIKV